MKRQHPTDPNLFWCPKCQGYKARGDFYKWGDRPIVIDSRCKRCRSQAHTTKCTICSAIIKAAGGAKYCTECWKEKEKERCKIKMVKQRSTIEGRRKSIQSCYKYYHNHLQERRSTARIRIKIWKKENQDKDRKLRVNYKKRLVAEIRDNYLVGLLKRYRDVEITPGLIELKRQQIISKRTLTQFKKWREQNESDHKDVYREQRQNEEDHEKRLQTGTDCSSAAVI